MTLPVAKIKDQLQKFVRQMDQFVYNWQQRLERWLMTQLPVRGTPKK